MASKRPPMDVVYMINDLVGKKLLSKASARQYNQGHIDKNELLRQNPSFIINFQNMYTYAGDEAFCNQISDHFNIRGIFCGKKEDDEIPGGKSNKQNKRKTKRRGGKRNKKQRRNKRNTKKRSRKHR